LGHCKKKVTPLAATIISDGSILTIFHSNALKVDNLHPLRLSLSPKTKCPKEILGALMNMFEEARTIQGFYKKSRLQVDCEAENTPH
jgi:hypothetical protein